ncbi:MAG TPA: TonB family protein [Mucilaginibacter sp.]
MKLKLYLPVIYCLLCFNYAFAQKQNVYFLKKNGKEVKVRDSADYIRILTEPDSGTTFYNVKEYYKNGKFKLVGKSSKVEYNSLEGQCVFYYPSGSKQQVANYKQNFLMGDVYDFYPNGKLHTYKQYKSKPEPGHAVEVLMLACNDSTGKVLAANGNGYYIWYSNDFKNVVEEGNIKAGLRDGKWKGSNGNEKDLLTFEEDYNNGKLIQGRSLTHQDNKSFTYTIREVTPQYPGGVNEFYKFIAQNVKYPYNARMNHIQGEVFTSFVVEADGSLSDIKIVRSPDAELSEETLRVIKLSPNWIPGAYFGRPARVQYTVPTRFTLGSH